MNKSEMQSSDSGKQSIRRTSSVQCAFISLQNNVFEGQDDSQLAAQLNAHGWDIKVVDWKDQTVDWDTFDLAVMRSPWDYHLNYEAFVQYMDRISASRCLFLNDPQLIRMNSDKRYLIELGRRCDVIIPTLLFERDSKELHAGIQNSARKAVEVIGQAFEQFQVDEVVVKPTVGAGSDRTLRVKQGELSVLNAAIHQIIKERDILIQPFLPTITGPGEFSLVFIEGEYYHCILKRPKDGDFRVQCQHGGIYERHEPDPWLISTSRDLLRSFAPTAVYARLDWVLHPDCDSLVPYLLMEMELIEPDLYLRYTSQGIPHFANALVRAYEMRKTSNATATNGVIAS